MTSDIEAAVNRLEIDDFEAWQIIRQLLERIAQLEQALSLFRSG